MCDSWVTQKAFERLERSDANVSRYVLRGAVCSRRGSLLFNNMKIFIGIDVGKMFLDISINDKHFRVNNDKEGYCIIEKQIKENIQINDKCILVCEASGGYEKNLITYFSSKGFDTHVAHANKVKAFARSKGYIAKTDKIDCKIISEYGKAMDVSNDAFQLSEGELSIKNLIVRREQLMAHKQQETNRLDKCSDPVIKRSVQKLIKYLEKEIVSLKPMLEKQQKSSDAVNDKINLLSSIPCVGPLTAQYVVAYLPELGSVSNKALAALVGVAPYCRDSGKHSGKRFIQGGRKRLRKQLYMAAVSSIIHNPLLSNFYKRLRKKGKLAKVALVAVIRKLLSILNAVIQRNSVWEKREDFT